MLPLCALKMALLVCRWWRDVGQSKPLWRLAMVNVTKKNLFAMPNFIWSRRIQAADTLGINAINETMLFALSGHPGIRKLKIHADTDLSAVNPQLFADTICKKESVDMYNVFLTNHQQRIIMSRIYSGSDIQSLTISCCDLTSVDPSLIACAVNKLSKVSLHMSLLTIEQVEAILTTALVETRLTNLYLSTCVNPNSFLVYEAGRKISSLSIEKQKTIRHCRGHRRVVENRNPDV